MVPASGGGAESAVVSRDAVVGGEVGVVSVGSKGPTVAMSTALLAHQLPPLS